MTEQEEKMMFAAFALAGILANSKVTNHQYAHLHAWEFAERMVSHNKQKENDDGDE